MCWWRGAQGGSYPVGYPVGYVGGRGGVGAEVTLGTPDPLLRKPGVAVVHHSIVTHCIAPRGPGTAALLSKYPSASASLARAREQRLFTVPSAMPSIRAVSATE